MSVVATPPCSFRNCDDPALFSEKLNRHIRECERHQRERLERDAARRKRKQDGGECMACSNPRDGTSVYCLGHKQAHAGRMKRRRTANRQAGTCVECGGEASNQLKRCDVHIAQQREYVAKIDRLSPDHRRHYANYCSICGVFRVTEGRFCGVCDTSRTQCVEYRWHEYLRECATVDGLWPPSSSTFTEKRAFGTYECANEKLVYSDMVWVLDDRVVVLECDEQSHDDRPVECELARMDSIQFGVREVLPLTILRFNPHQPGRRLVFADLETKVREFWRDVKHHLTTTTLPPLNKVNVLYFHYADDSKHVEATQASPRFVTQVKF